MKNPIAFLHRPMALAMAFCLCAMPMPAHTYALAPSSLFDGEGRVEVDLAAYLASELFRSRVYYMAKGWSEGTYERPASTRMAYFDQTYLTTTRHDPLISFEYDRIRPLGIDRVCLQGEILRGDRKGEQVFLILSKRSIAHKDSFRSARPPGTDEEIFEAQAAAHRAPDVFALLADTSTFYAYVRAELEAQLFSPGLQRVLDMALNEYQLRARQWEKSAISERESLRKRIVLANNVFARVIGKENAGLWLTYMSKCIFSALPPRVQASLMLLNEMSVQHEMKEYLNGLLPPESFPRIGLANVLDIEGKGPEGRFLSMGDLDIKRRREVVDILLDQSYLLSEEREMVLRMALGSPWGDAAYFPLPSWFRLTRRENQPESIIMEQHFLLFLERMRLTPQELSLLADPGALEKHRTAIAMDIGRLLSQGEQADAKEEVGARDIREDLDLLGALTASLSQSETLPDVAEVRIVEEVVAPSAKTLAPEIIQARLLLQKRSSMAHDVKSPVSTIMLTLGAIGTEIHALGGVPEKQRTAMRGSHERMELFIARLSQVFEQLRIEEDVSDVWHARSILENLNLEADLILENLRALSREIDLYRTLGESAGIFYPRFPATADEEAAEDESPERAEIMKRLQAWMQVIDKNMVRAPRVLLDVMGEARPPLSTENLGKILEDWSPKDLYAQHLQGVLVDPPTMTKDIPLVRINEDELLRVLGNLVINAGQHLMKHVPMPQDGGPRGRISVRLRRDDGGHLRIEIENDGPGMDRKIQHKIFRRYFTEGKGDMGTGIGLHDARRIVESYGGAIWVESAPNRGTKFSIALPDAKAQGPTLLASRHELLTPNQMAVFAVLPFLGNGGNEVARLMADEAATNAYEQAKGVLEGLPVQATADPMLHTHGIVQGAATDTMSVTLYTPPGSIVQLPQGLFMHKWMVGRDGKGAALNPNGSTGENLDTIAKTLAKRRATEIGRADLKGAILFKPRHRSLIREMIQGEIFAGEGLLKKKDGEYMLKDGKYVIDEEKFDQLWRGVEEEIRHGRDVTRGNLTFLARKDVGAVHGLHTGVFDFLTGADGVNEGITAVGFNEAYGGESSVRLVPGHMLLEEREENLLTNLNSFSKEEKAGAESVGFFGRRRKNLAQLERDEYRLDHVFSGGDLIRTGDLVLMAVALKNSLWVPGLKGIRIDRATGNKQVGVLIAAKGKLPKILEITYEGDYLEWQGRIGEARDTPLEARLRENFAELLVRDGWYDHALAQLEKAQEVSRDPRRDGITEAYRGLRVLVEELGGQKRSIAHLEKGSRDMDSPVRIEEILALLKAEQPTKIYIPGPQYQLEFDKSTGRVRLHIFDQEEGVSYAMPVSTGIVGGDGRVISTNQYAKHDLTVTDAIRHREVAVRYWQPRAAGLLPVINVTYRIPKDSSEGNYFTFTMTVQNNTGKEFRLQSWRLLGSEDVALGPTRMGLRSGTSRDLGVFWDIDSQLAFAVEYPGARMDIQDAPKRFMAVAHIDEDGEEAVPVDEDVALKSDVLWFRIDQKDPLYSVPGYAVWDMMRVVHRKRGQEVSEADFRSMYDGLESHEQDALRTAIALFGNEEDRRVFQRYTESIALMDMPMDLGGYLLRRRAQAEEGEADEDIVQGHAENGLFAVDLGPEAGKLVALFNFSGTKTDWDLLFLEHLGLDPGKDFLVMDVLKGEYLGAEFGNRVRGDYYFHEHELPADGVKLLLIRDPDMMAPAEPIDADALLGASAHPVHSAL